jgi:hypothetical protein
LIVPKGPAKNCRGASSSSQFEHPATLASQRQREYWRPPADVEVHCLAPMDEYKEIFIHGYFFT